MHVYHYGAYETTAIGQLMGVYATREDAVDELLRREVFVDLHGVVRQGLRAGVPSYSLKEIEALAAFRRRAGVTTGTHAVLEYERWMDTRADARLQAIAVYNEDDCRATLALRDWLLAHRPADAVWAEVPEPRDVTEEKRTADAEREALRQSLLAGSDEGSPRWLAGELLEYHRREVRPAWWWFFARCKMSGGELVAAALRPASHDGPDDRPRRAARAGRDARRQLSLHPGTSRHGQDLDGRADRRRADPPRPARRHRGDEPQGDPQSAGRDHERRPRRSAPLPRPQEVERAEHRDRVPERIDHQQGRARRRDRRRPARQPARRHGVALRAPRFRRGGPDRHADHRRGGAGRAGRRARHGHGGSPRHPARRPAPAPAGLSGHASGPHRRLRSRALAGPTRHRAARDGRVPRPDAPHAPRRLPVRF